MINPINIKNGLDVCTIYLMPLFLVSIGFAKKEVRNLIFLTKGIL